MAVAALALLSLEIFRGGAGTEFSEFESGAAYDSNSDITLNADRPASLFLPLDYSSEKAVPLLINLHGYSGESIGHSSYTFLQAMAKERGLAYVAPDGTIDSLQNQFWNASIACCNFNDVAVDDVAYIKSLIDEASQKVSIDPMRIYLFGHSNGHFMSYKFACSTKGVLTAIAGLAGAMDSDPNVCNKEPMNILHIHGTGDLTILYDGGNLLGNPYPSAQQSINQWSAINRCTKPTESQFDLLQSMQGDDSSAISYTCKKD
jgi:polyhydroxybutyrate depolymerase